MLATNQVKYSLLDRRVEANGTLAAAKELGVTIIAHSPLEQGLLTGRYHQDPDYVRRRPGPRKWMRRYRGQGLEQSRRIIEELQTIARAHGVTPAQVAVAWLCQFNAGLVVAIPVASRVEQAVENGRTLELTLARPELEKLDHLSSQGTRQ